MKAEFILNAVEGRLRAVWYTKMQAQGYTLLKSSVEVMDDIMVYRVQLYKGGTMATEGWLHVKQPAAVRFNDALDKFNEVINEIL